MGIKVDLIEVLKTAGEKRASDVFVVAGLPLSIKVRGAIIHMTEEPLAPDDTAEIVKKIYALSDSGSADFDNFYKTGDADFSISVEDAGRFRVNTYRQKGSLAAVLRLIAFKLPDSRTLGIPNAVIDLYKKKKGIILVTGPTGSGKSTTLACLIDAINSNRTGHIMTLEDPIEFLHNHKKSIVSQREIMTDTESYARGLKSVLRQAPDVILIGEMRDIETIGIALTAAETGHLLLSTLHTMGASNTIDRIVDIFPAAQQQQIRTQLSMTLIAVISQQLVPAADKSMAAAFEIMINTTAIANMIREGKMHQIHSTIQTSGGIGMQTMESSLAALVKKGVVTRETALLNCSNPDVLTRML